MSVTFLTNEDKQELEQKIEESKQNSGGSGGKGIQNMFVSSSDLPVAGESSEVTVTVNYTDFTKDTLSFDVPPGPPGNDYVLTEEDKAEIAEQAAELVDVPEGGSSDSLTAIEKTVILSLLKNAVYTSDVSDVISALESAWKDGEAPICYITNNLTNINTNNSATDITTGESYSATLTATDGYKIDSVVIIMDGKDITSSAYADGKINIAVVTGDISITATATEINFVSCEIGTIVEGVEQSNPARVVTDYIPYDPTNNTVLVDVLFNGANDVGFALTPYDSNKNHLFGEYGAFGLCITPSTQEKHTLISGWGDNMTKYSLKYGSDVAYVRAVFRNVANANVSDFSGTITISGIEYELKGV